MGRFINAFDPEKGLSRSEANLFKGFLCDIKK